MIIGRAGLILLMLALLAVMARAGMTLTSPAFRNGQPIPDLCARQVGNQSPELRIAGVPKKAQSLVLICDDPDAPAGDWVHWILSNIPATTTVIAADDKSIGTAGKNSFGDTGWDGPQPPSGTHRYIFTLYALDLPFNADPGATRPAILAAIKPHVVGSCRLMGTYTAR